MPQELDEHATLVLWLVGLAILLVALLCSVFTGMDYAAMNRVCEQSPNHERRVRRTLLVFCPIFMIVSFVGIAGSAIGWRENGPLISLCMLTGSVLTLALSIRWFLWAAR